jgi:anti-sigma factor RsiW
MMAFESQTYSCPTDDIAAYIDGELKPARELELEAHFVTCGGCRQFLNEQKQFLRDLDTSLRHEGDLDLPAGFAKTVVANAESSVKGLRRASECFNAVFICAALGLFALFAMGSDADRSLQGVSSAADQTFAAGAFFGHIVYSVFLGIVIVLRAVASQFEFGVYPLIALLLVLAVSALLFSRRILKTFRA